MLPKLRVSVTHNCDMNCFYCPRGPTAVMENYNGNSQPLLTASEFNQILTIMANCGLKDVHFTGGEPLLREDLAQLIGQATSLGMNVELNTNGLGLTKEKIVELRQLDISLLKISLDSPDRETFKEFTGIDGFDQVVNGIREVVPHIPVRLNTVMVKRNLFQLEELLKLVQILKVRTIHLLDLTYYPGMDLWEEEFVNLTEEVKPILEEKYGACQSMDIYGCHFSKFYLPESGTTIVLKEADTTMRNSVCCNQCESYCHEGLFTLRLSADGYLNVCPMNNKLGVDTRKLLKNGGLEKTLLSYAKLFGLASPVDSFATFLGRNNLASVLGGCI